MYTLFTGERIIERLYKFSNNHIPEYDPIYIYLSFKDNTNIKIDGGLNLHDDISLL